MYSRTTPSLLTSTFTYKSPIKREYLIVIGSLIVILILYKITNGSSQNAIINDMAMAYIRTRKHDHKTIV